MATTVELPQLGNTVEECLITRWVKRKGDAVSAGDVVAEIETDKTTFEVTAPVDGVVLETFGDEGDLVPVFTKLFVIGEVGERLDISLAPDVSRDPGSVGSAPAETIGSGHSGAAPKAGSREPIARSFVRAAPLSPRAQRFASERGFNAGSLAGSGPGGRVLERDVRKAYEASLSTRSTTTSNTRQTIARRMRDSLATTAQYTLIASADAGGLVALRARCKASSGLEGITINDLVAFCTIRSLVQAPDLNAEFIDGEIVKHTEIHLAFACDTPKGLMAPVVRDAQALSILELSDQIEALSRQAVEGTILSRDVAGATFTISNLGHLGIESFTPVLNPPQVGILGVGSIQPKPVRSQGGVEFIDAIGFSLTCDHQVIDGAPGARFLQTLKEKIETVESYCELLATMPKSIVIEPKHVFTREVIQFSDIPVNAYDRTIEDEQTRYSTEDLLHIWRDMCGIREFETVLNEIKTKGAYKGTTYNHAGPAHLSIGQEAAAVGMAFSLSPDDHIFGSHRSHGEILAKAFSAIRQLDDEPLLAIMESYRDGVLLRPVERGFSGTVQELAVRFFVYGAYSEIFARETGFNRGLGGSMHAFFAPFGIYPNNAIVGGSGSMAPGRGALQARAIGSRGSSSPTSAIRRLAAVLCGKASRFRRWISIGCSGISRSAAVCRSSSTA